MTQLDKQKGDLTHRYPQVLPGAHAVMFTSNPNLTDYSDARVEVQSFTTGKRNTLVKGAIYGRYLPTGHLVYVRQGTLFAAPMNVERLELTGPASPVLENVSDRQAAAQFDFSRQGTFVYIPGKAALSVGSIGVLDSGGNIETLPASPGSYTAPRVSPDGTRIVLRVADAANFDLWIYELAGRRLSRLTTVNSVSTPASWTADGQHLVFGSNAPTPGRGLYWIRADGATEPQLLIPGVQADVSFSPNSNRLAFVRRAAEGSEIVTVPLDLSDPERPSAGQPETFLHARFSLAVPRFATDGRWIAYQSNESGRPDIYVRLFPGPGGKWSISTGGGTNPIWSPSSQELFFRLPDGHIAVASYTTEGKSFIAEQPRLWSPKWDDRTTLGMDTMRDGKHFLVLSASERPEKEAPQTHATFLFNFFDELRQRVPANRK